MCEHHCHQGHADTMINLQFLDFLGLSEWSIVISLFITGLFGSFTHCIAMCGPFSLSISEMRLMSLGGKNMTQSRKIMALFATPYYLGKAVTYTIIGVVFYLASEMLKNIPGFHYLAFVLLSLIVVAFISMGFNASTNFSSKLGLNFNWMTKALERLTKTIGSQFGIRGFLTGMILGLIPCGLVVASITQAAAQAETIVIMMSATFAFGIATVPGLFITALFGGLMLNSTSKRVLSILYSLMMFYNAFILMKYALRLL
jgi:sulfite exporter TauE/SafE